MPRAQVKNPTESAKRKGSNPRQSVKRNKLTATGKMDSNGGFNRSELSAFKVFRQVPGTGKQGAPAS
jgi:hypothetical protein